MTDSIKIRETCPECEGYGEFGPVDETVDCLKCHGTGKIPIIYTPEKWLAAGYELHGNTYVWFLTTDKKWVHDIYHAAKWCLADKIIIATQAITREVLEGLE